MRLALTIPVVLLALSLDATANAPRPLAAVREACRSDVQTYCQGIRPGQGRIRACLRSNRDRLSQGCRSAIVAAIDARRAAWAGTASKAQADD